MIGDFETHPIGTGARLKRLADAAERLLAGLNERIEQAPGSAVPVFDGIADLHDALGEVRSAA